MHSFPLVYIEQRRINLSDHMNYLTIILKILIPCSSSEKSLWQTLSVPHPYLLWTHYSGTSTIRHWQLSFWGLFLDHTGQIRSDEVLMLLEIDLSQWLREVWNSLPLGGITICMAPEFSTNFELQLSSL